MEETKGQQESREQDTYSLKIIANCLKELCEIKSVEVELLKKIANKEQYKE